MWSSGVDDGMLVNCLGITGCLLCLAELLMTDCHECTSIPYCSSKVVCHLALYDWSCEESLRLCLMSHCDTVPSCDGSGVLTEIDVV